MYIYFTPTIYFLYFFGKIGLLEWRRAWDGLVRGGCLSHLRFQVISTLPIVVFPNQHELPGIVVLFSLRTLPPWVSLMSLV